MNNLKTASGTERRYFNGKMYIFLIFARYIIRDRVQIVTINALGPRHLCDTGPEPIFETCWEKSDIIVAKLTLFNG